MANYTTADIQALRERTGAGMLDVKKTLDEDDGDIDKALEIILVNGLRGVAKREGRATADGVIVDDIRPGDEGEVGTMVEVNSETDFVSKNEEFGKFADTVLAQAVATGATDVETLLASNTPEGTPLSEVVAEVAARLGERIVVNRVVRLTAEKVTSYLHKTNPDLPPQLGVLVATDAAGAEVARDVGTHIAAYSPQYLTREDVPEDIVADERRIAEEIARNENKPGRAFPRILGGGATGSFRGTGRRARAIARAPRRPVPRGLEEAAARPAGLPGCRVAADPG